MTLRFYPGALQEYQAAVEHYESRQVGLGARFIQAIEDALDSVRDAPDRWPVLEQDVRRRLVRVFPYALLYTVEADHVLILAVMHCHRRPGYWRSRVRKG